MTSFHAGDAVLVHVKEGELHPLVPGVVASVGRTIGVRLGDGRTVRVSPLAVHPDPLLDDTGCWRCGKRIVPR